MSSPKTCMTLRLDPAIDELVAEAAHDKGVTKTDWIRSAIRQRLKAQMTLERNQRIKDEHPS
jgi:uncharacterized protein (DUF1778 family)